MKLEEISNDGMCISIMMLRKKNGDKLFCLKSEDGFLDFFACRGDTYKLERISAINMYDLFSNDWYDMGFSEMKDHINLCVNKDLITFMYVKGNIYLDILKGIQQ
jgi:hypothetical protein